MIVFVAQASACGFFVSVANKGTQAEVA